MGYEYDYSQPKTAVKYTVKKKKKVARFLKTIEKKRTLKIKTKTSKHQFLSPSQERLKKVKQMFYS